MPYEVWPDNWRVLNVFWDSQSQWAHGPSGHRTGLRFEGVQVVMKAYGIKKRERLDMLADLNTCQNAALDAWSRK